MHGLDLTIEQGVAVLTFDVPGSSVNTFTRGLKDAFVYTLERIETDQSVRAAVLISGKPDTFVAGADIEEFLTWKTAEQASNASREGHRLLDRIERSRLPFVAAIHGACLGGGLETALACAWRIATDHPKTVLALPEVQLGLIPGAGGTQRLPRVVGLQAALDMILTGKNVRAKKAAQLGLVHEMVHPSILRSIAIQRALELADGRRKRNAAAREHSASTLLLDENPIGRAFVFRKAREMTTERTKGHYPAPLAALDVIGAGYGSRDRGFEEEARTFGELAMTPVSRELIHLFFASTALKKDPGVSPPVDPMPVRSIGVIGAGFMGAGIAAVAVQQGVSVRLKDATLEGVGRGLASIREVLGDRLRKRQITRQQLTDQMLLAGGTIDYSGFAGLDLVIEAVFEDLTVKHKVLRETEALIDDTAIFASNTSTIPIARIAEAARRPERVVGMHFFSPVPKMPLLEVIAAPATAPHVVATAVAFGKTLGKTVIVVRDAPGFYVNRILAPYLNEAGRLLDEGASIDVVDRAMVEFGFPVGPFTLLDEVGLDVAGKSGAVLHEAFGDRFAPSGSLRAIVEAGRTGRKGRSGFYRYEADGSKGGVDESVYSVLDSGSQRRDLPVVDIQRRLATVMVNEAVLCLEQGIVASARDGDLGAVFGIGFPPFRGGPFRYIDAVGPATVLQTMEDLAFRHPGRHLAAEPMVQMARKGERFHAQT